LKRVQGDGRKNLEIALQSLKGRVLKVGWVQDKRYPGGKMSTAGVAAIAEVGYAPKNIPPRPIMGPVNREKKELWARISSNELKKVFVGKQTGQGAWDTLGLKISGDYRRQITQIQSPPLKPATIRARLYQTNAAARAANAFAGKKKRRIVKYSNVKDSPTYGKPLVFTKYLLNSLSYSVEIE
jgi:hypothetical protein